MALLLNAAQPQPEMRFPSFMLCHKFHYSMVVSTLNPNFEVLRLHPQSGFF